MNVYKKLISTTYLEISLLALIGTVITLLFASDLLIPIGEKYSDWFQRSGAIIVMTAILIELRLSQRWNLLLEDIAEIEAQDVYKRHKKIRYAIDVFIVGFSFGGTILWAYGDLLV